MLLLLEREALRLLQSGIFENHSLHISVKQAEEPPTNGTNLGGTKDWGTRPGDTACQVIRESSCSSPQCEENQVYSNFCFLSMTKE